MLTNMNTSLSKIRELKPIVLCLTNYVTMNIVANTLLATGASPIMSVCDEELDELIKISNSLVINIGTLDKSFITRVEKACQLAKKYKKPIILDPVGSGASVIRTKTARKLAPLCNIIKGNASEIISLHNEESKTYGVETKHEVCEAATIAENISKKIKCIIAISGAKDFVTNGTKNIECKGGSPLMNKITGMGCSLAGIIGAFSAVSANNFDAAVQAIEFFNICGENASKKTNVPGSFQIKLLNSLYSFNTSE